MFVIYGDPITIPFEHFKVEVASHIPIHVPVLWHKKVKAQLNWNTKLRVNEMDQQNLTQYDARGRRAEHLAK